VQGVDPLLLISAWQPSTRRGQPSAAPTRGRPADAHTGAALTGPSTAALTGVPCRVSAANSVPHTPRRWAGSHGRRRGQPGAPPAAAATSSAAPRRADRSADCRADCPPPPPCASAPAIHAPPAPGAAPGPSGAARPGGPARESQGQPPPEARPRRSAARRAAWPPRLAWPARPRPGGRAPPPSRRGREHRGRARACATTPCASRETPRRPPWRFARGLARRREGRVHTPGAACPLGGARGAL